MRYASVSQTSVTVHSLQILTNSVDPLTKIILIRSHLTRNSRTPGREALYYTVNPDKRSVLNVKNLQNSFSFYDATGHIKIS